MSEVKPTGWYARVRDLIAVIPVHLFESESTHKGKICKILQTIDPSIGDGQAVHLYESASLPIEELAVCQMVGPTHAVAYMRELDKAYREILGRWASWCKANLGRKVLCAVIDFAIESKKAALPLLLFDTLLWETEGLRQESPGVEVKSNAREHRFPVVPAIKDAKPEALRVITSSIRSNMRELIAETSQKGFNAQEVLKTVDSKFTRRGEPVSPSPYVQECIDYITRSN